MDLTSSFLSPLPSDVIIDVGYIFGEQVCDDVHIAEEGPKARMVANTLRR